MAIFRATEARPHPRSFLDADHNHLQQEIHLNRTLFIHRKDAQAAALDPPGRIPGSMAAPSAHTSGRGCPASLGSSSHGIGWILSRHQVRKAISTSAIKQQLRGIWYDHRVADALREEGPSAYRDLHAILRAQHELTRIVRTLRLVLSYKFP